MKKLNVIIISMLTLSILCSACDKTAQSNSTVLTKPSVIVESKLNSQNNDANIQSFASKTIANKDNKNEVKNNKIVQTTENKITEYETEIIYKNMLINHNTPVERIIERFGFPTDYELNNNGYISGNSSYRRWNLCYPNFSEPEIRIIVLSERDYTSNEIKDRNSYIVGICLESYATNKGLKVGDDFDKVLRLYGNPNYSEKNNENGCYLFRYTAENNLNLEILLDKDMKNVENIFLDYNMKKSTDEQQSKDTLED